ncbi:MAG: hypothetical protein JWO96_142 [Candidatus Saccharibacteria bacterium]|nr:hypothetical protein [Candidatus Saccharibacteria bacterium]
MAQIRQVANIERDLGHILHVSGFEVGVRILHPHLLRPLQLYLYDRPQSEFAIMFKVAGQLSRTDERAHGFVKLFYDHIEVPLTDWSARDAGENVKGEVTTLVFGDKTTAELKKLCGQAHKERLQHLLNELLLTARAAWVADSSILEISQLAQAALAQDPMLSIGTICGLGEWITDVLGETHLEVWNTLAI